LKKITYLISNINKAIAFEWIVEQLDPERYQLSFILLNPGVSEFENYLAEHHIPFTRIDYCGPGDLPKALLRTIQIFKKSKPDIIHCHLFDATLMGLTAGKLAGVKKRIYTRHHSTYNWQYNKKGVWLDRLINWLATDIVAISKNVRKVLLKTEHVPLHKIHLIHHGFDLDAFRIVDKERIKSLSDKHKIIGKKPIIGVIARWIEWKGIQYIIPAFRKLLETHPDALLILANANGPYKPEIERLLHELPEDTFQTIPFENDLFALYQLFDVYVHTPINPTIEAFGQTYVEALAAGVPSVFTMSGVAPEFIEHEKNALLVPFEDEHEIYKSIMRLLRDKDLSARLVENGKRDIQTFALHHMIHRLEKLYLASERQVRRWSDPLSA
jgi:glycosyltransferase involved in cell wall biosynthesis